MSERHVVIASSVGLHARPASMFVQQVGASGVDVQIGRPGEESVDAASILGVMALGAKHGDEVVLSAEGDRADAVLEELAALLSRDLDSE